MAGGIWTLDGDQLLQIEDASDGDGPAVVLVRSEHVLLLVTPLPPLASTLRRREALPFAIEEHISEPLDQVHIALGAQTAPGVWLAGVVSHAMMTQWLDNLALAGLDRAHLVPDVMVLPVPGAGCWSVDLAGERALVRAADGSGFAIPATLLEAAWHAAGNPACVAYGDPLPPQLVSADADMAAARPLVPQLLAAGIDLRQGRYAAPRRAFNPLWRRIALVAGIGALAHGAIALADTIALAHLANVRAAQVREFGAGLQPPVEIGADLGDAIVALTPDPAAAGPGRFMSLLSRSAAALGAGATWRSVSFDGAAGTLTIELETANIADLQRMAQALTQAGLSAQPGSAATQGGKAVGSFVIRGL